VNSNKSKKYVLCNTSHTKSLMITTDLRMPSAGTSSLVPDLRQRSCWSSYLKSIIITSRSLKNI